jgi:pimeloyl-ACP methyl ester carboxylesterase
MTHPAPAGARAVPTAATSAATTEYRAILNGVEQFYLDLPGEGPPLVMLHGLSSNAHAFSGLISAGLSPAFRVVAPDLRGRARSGKPASGYGMPEHAADIIALLDHLGLERVVLAGHSFGGYLGIYLAASFPERIEKLIVIDAAITSHPRIGVALKPSLDRLTKVAPSLEAYLNEIKSAPYMDGAWDEDVERYFRAELSYNDDGSVQATTSAAAVGQAALGLAVEPWLHHVQHVRQATLVLNALGAYGPPGALPLIDEITARATARAFPNSTYRIVPGNHISMVFGTAGAVVKQAIEDFLHSGTDERARRV